MPSQTTHSPIPRICRLRCESQREPMGIDTRAPRLSWVIESQVRGQHQTAYRILAARTLQELEQDKASLWDSGKALSPQTINIVYAGIPLASGQTVFWKVRIWDKDGQMSDWSTPSSWEMGLLDATDWKGYWIGDGKLLPDKDEDFYRDDPAPLFRREFTLTKPVARARLYFSGLGYGQASLNGESIGDHLLAPIWTRWDKRIFYSIHDVTGQLSAGSNCIGVTLGNGWYNPLPLKMWGHKNIRNALPVGRPRFIAQLEVEHSDGSRTTLATDSSWKWAPGPLLRNSIYLGEKFDATREIANWDKPGLDDAGWRPVQQVAAPGGALQARPLPPIRTTARLTTVRITEPTPGVYLVDMGQNFGGLAQFTFDVPRGTLIVLRYGELLHDDGTLNPMTSVCGQIKGEPTPPDHPGQPGIAWQSDTYIARGGGPETYTPRFTYHAFRYVEITGLPTPPTPDSITGLRLNCDVPRSGHFSCSTTLFNRIQTICDWTFLSNLFGVQSDCPHRERFGYGGDLVTTSDAFMMNYDMSGFYAKAARDWHDSALPDGMLTDTAPSVGIQYCGVGWAMAHPLLQLQLYRYYGDRRLVEEQYAVSKRWFDLVRAQTPDFILEKGLHDHEALEKEEKPPMVTPLYCECARMVSRLARILGRESEAADYANLAEQIKAAYIQRFLHAGTGVVASGIQGVQAFALALDMLPERERTSALNHLVNDINMKHGGHLTTGIFGTKFLLEVLSREGEVETAHRMVNHRDFPSWGHMLENGATTLWESWKSSDSTFSHNHPMFGSVSQWFYNWLGGIEPALEAVGFDRIQLHPRFVQGVDWVDCTVETVRGPVTCNWKREATGIVMDIVVPVGSTAFLSLPGTARGRLTENGKPVEKADGVEVLPSARGLRNFSLASGSYRLEWRGQQPVSGNTDR